MLVKSASALTFGSFERMSVIVLFIVLSSSERVYSLMASCWYWARTCCSRVSRSKSLEKSFSNKLRDIGEGLTEKKNEWAGQNSGEAVKGEIMDMVWPGNATVAELSHYETAE